jgi:hypothetical protein
MKYEINNIKLKLEIATQILTKSKILKYNETDQNFIIIGVSISNFNFDIIYNTFHIKINLTCR